MTDHRCRLEQIEVRGIVQGVGFRPFVHDLTVRHQLGGYVLNHPDGVLIEVEGEPESVDAFVSNLERHAPPLAHIVELRRQVLAESGGSSRPDGRYDRFDIRASHSGRRPATLISPDVCVCEACLNELFDRADRRYLYPFINCTNCGPRFTIIKSLPYDRPLATLPVSTRLPFRGARGRIACSVNECPRPCKPAASMSGQTARCRQTTGVSA